MAYTPTVYVNGTTPATNATNLNKAENELARKGKLTMVRRASAAESVTTGGSAKSATWDTEVQDDLGAFVIGTPDRITVQEDGVYMVVAHVPWDTNVTGDRYMHLERIRASDGNQEVLDAHADKATIVSENQQTCVAVTPLLNGDSLRVKLFQNSGSTINWGGQGRTSGNPVASSTVAEFTVCQISS